MLFLLPLTRHFVSTSSVGGEVIGLLRVIILKNKLVVPGRVELPTHPCEGYVITVSPQN